MRCQTHPDVVSTSCQQCGRPFCPECVHSTTSCRECGYAAVVGQAQARAHELAATPAAAHAGTPRWHLPAGLVLLGALLVAFAAGPPLFPRRVHGAAGVAPAKTRAGFPRCVQQLWELRAGIQAHVRAHGTPPASLQELPARLRQQTCPALGHAYGYAVQPAEDVDGDGPPAFYLCCPDPTVHNVQALECGPESMAPVVTP